MEGHSESKKLKFDDLTVAGVSEVNAPVNPLLNPLVIEKVFECLATSITSTNTADSFSPSKVTLDDIKNFRLVCKCKSWHGETVKLWRQSATLKIIRESDDNNYNNNDHNGAGVQNPTITGTGMGVKRFLQYWDADTDRLRTRPFVRFNLSGFGVNGVGSDHDLDLQHPNHRFWKVIKDTMEHLRVENCEFSSTSTSFYREFRAFLGMRKPNLRSFVLKDLDFCVLRGNRSSEDDSDSDSDEDVPSIGDIPDPRYPEQQETDFGCGANLRSLEVTWRLETVSWKDVVKNWPNLETLKIGSWELMDGFSNAVPYSGHLSKLRHVCVGAPVYFVREDLLNLLHSEPPLETLSVFIPYPNYRGHHHYIGVDECLETVSKTLRTLHLTCDDIWGQGIGGVKYDKNNPFYDLRLVAIPTLKELCMWGNLVGNLNFLKFFPNLEILKINLSLFQKREEMDRFQEDRRRDDDEVLQEFWRGRNKKKTAEDIVKLTEIETSTEMENLTHFRYDFDRLPVASWKLLGTWMPNLRKLEAVLTNETLAIVGAQWPDLWELGCLFGSTVDDEGVVTMAMGGICLKNLSKLRIEYQCGGLGKLTDACVSGGLLKMSCCLNHLEILNCPKLSDDSVEKLNEEISFVRIVKSCRGENENFECCQRRKFDEVFSRVRDDDDEYYEDDVEVDSDENESPTTMSDDEYDDDDVEEDSDENESLTAMTT